MAVQNFPSSTRTKITRQLPCLSQTVNSPCECLIRTWRGKCVDLIVGDRHDGVTEFLHEVRDGLVCQERCHRGEQQVYEDEHHREDIFKTCFTEFH